MLLPCASSEARAQNLGSFLLNNQKKLNKLSASNTKQYNLVPNGAEENDELQRERLEIFANFGYFFRFFASSSSFFGCWKFVAWGLVESGRERERPGDDDGSPPAAPASADQAAGAISGGHSILSVILIWKYGKESEQKKLVKSIINTKESNQRRKRNDCPKESSFSQVFPFGFPYPRKPKILSSSAIRTFQVSLKLANKKRTRKIVFFGFWKGKPKGERRKLNCQTWTKHPRHLASIRWNDLWKKTLEKIFRRTCFFPSKSLAFRGEIEFYFVVASSSPSEWFRLHNGAFGVQCVCLHNAICSAQATISFSHRIIVAVVVVVVVVQLKTPSHHQENVQRLFGQSLRGWWPFPPVSNGCCEMRTPG